MMSILSFPFSLAGFESLNLNLAKTPNRAPSPHRSGEKVAEGRMRGLTSAHFTLRGASLDRLRMKCEIQAANPPSSGFATFSPRKKRGGRRRSIGGCDEGFEVVRGLVFQLQNPKVPA